MAAIISADIAQAIVKLVAADALPALMGNLVTAPLVDRSYEPLLGHPRRYQPRCSTVKLPPHESGCSASINWQSSLSPTSLAAPEAAAQGQRARRGPCQR